METTPEKDHNWVVPMGITDVNKRHLLEKLVFLACLVEEVTGSTCVVEYHFN